MPQHHDTSAPPDTPSSPGDDDARDFEQFIAGQDPVDAAAAAWVVGRQEGLSPHEEAALQEWLAADPAHGKALDRLEGAWGRLDELPDEGIQTLKAGLPAAPSHSAPATAPRDIRPALSAPPRPSRFAWITAPGIRTPQFMAAVMAFLLIGGGLFGWQAWQNQPTFSQHYTTAQGQQQQVQLPDGSSLWLDTATRADVTLYRHRREVRLPEGQAQFTVHADAQQPFDVLAGPLRITVVGTRFSVRYTRTGLGDGGVSVVVEEGRVRVALSDTGDHRILTARNAPAPIELGAGQSISATPDGLFGLVTRQVSGAMAWREGRVNFDGVSLSQALAEFERYGPTRIVLSDPAVAGLRVHGSFDLRRLDAFTRALPRVLPVRVTPTAEGGIEIVGATSP